MHDRPALPTLEDVAREANVSTATISRCLNSPERVAKETRKRILLAVDSLGYSPNFGAKALASKKTNTIGAIIPTMANAIFARGLQAFQEELTTHNATLLVASSYYKPEIEEQQIRSMIARGADGLLLIGKTRNKRIYEFLKQRDIPFVIAWSYGSHTDRSYVGFDNASASFKLTESAINLGHRHFAFLTADRKSNDRAKDRVNGTKKALQKYAIDPSKLLIVEAPYSISKAGDAFTDIVTQQPQTTIVMCGNDVQAVGAMKQAGRLGIKVPKDMSITGFDNLEISTIIEPGVTTVHVPHTEMGTQAARVLLDRMHNNSDHQRVKLPTYIVERGSLAAPPMASNTRGNKPATA